MFLAVFFMRVDKNGSFDFAEGSALCIGAKSNVPFVRLAKIVLKKCAVGKKKKHWVGMSVGFLVLSIFHFSVLSQWFTFYFGSVVCLFTLGGNGYLYETFGISKHFPVKLQALLIRAETLDNPLTAKCFIYDVVVRFLFIFILLSSMLCSLKVRHKIQFYCN